MDDVIFLYSTAPDEKIALEIARTLVDRGVAACVNVIPGMTSVYRWKNEVETAAESVLIVKTTAGACEAARKVIEALHPYETPAISAIEINPALSSSNFIDWLRAAASP